MFVSVTRVYFDNFRIVFISHIDFNTVYDLLYIFTSLM